MVARLTAPTMEEPSATRLTSSGGGLLDEGDPSVEDVWGAAVMSRGLAGASMELAGDASSSAA